jgi:hypothetical protein
MLIIILSAALVVATTAAAWQEASGKHSGQRLYRPSKTIAATAILNLN